MTFPYLTGRWCVLTTSPARTLPLVRSLCAAGFEAWSPKHVIFRRRPRSNHTDEIEVPIAPTFVFLRACHVVDVAQLIGPGSVNPHPQFSFFRYAGRSPLVADHEIAGLQAEERAKIEDARVARKVLETERQRAEDKRRKTVRKEQRRAGRRALRTIEIGKKVAIQDGPWVGMMGVVSATDGRTAIVDMGGPWKVNVDTWLLLEETVRAA